MTRVNQEGAPIEETELFVPWGERATDDDRDMVIGLLLEKLNLKAVRTNATKHGNVEIELRKAD